MPKGSDTKEADGIRKELLQDKTLVRCRQLADKRERGYYWSEGILFHRISDIDRGVVDRVVLPKVRRKVVLDLAHAGLGHLSARKVKAILNDTFTWPKIATDVNAYCRSYKKCQEVNWGGTRKALMVTRPVIQVPFESVAIDIMGPLPKGKKGSRYILTYVCLASRWPEAVALKSVTANTVAEALVEILHTVASL